MTEENKQKNVCPHGYPCNKTYLTVMTGKRAKFVKSVSDVSTCSTDDDESVQTLIVKENDEVTYKQIKNKAALKAAAVILGITGVLSAVAEALIILFK